MLTISAKFNKKLEKLVKCFETLACTIALFLIPTLN